MLQQWLRYYNGGNTYQLVQAICKKCKSLQQMWQGTILPLLAF